MAGLDRGLHTYLDMLDYCQAWAQGGARTKQLSDFRESIQSAYRDVALATKWSYYLTEHRINLVAPYSTGTLSYDHTGGSSERLITFSTGLSSTVQDWAANGRLIISSAIHKVDRYLTDTTVTLDSILNPGADVTAGTSFTLYRNTYPFPDDMLTLDEVYIEKGFWQGSYITPSEWMARERFLRSGGRTDYWTIMRDTKTRNRWAIFVSPYASTAEPIGFIYRRRPRPLRFPGTESGERTATVTGTAAASTLTTSVALSTDFIGSVIRLRDDTTNIPTGMGGRYPYDEQHIIRDISSTTVTLDGTTLEKTYSGDKMVVSDPVDMNEAMLEAFKAQIEYRLARMHGGGRDMPSVNTYKTLAEKELRLAMECESRSGGMAGYALFDWVNAIRNATISTV